jgi:hypothetical protein
MLVAMSEIATTKEDLAVMGDIAIGALVPKKYELPTFYPCFAGHTTYGASSIASSASRWTPHAERF